MTEHEQDSKFTKNKRQDGENKMDIQEWIIFAIELIGTVAFSASGAMVGIECSMDIFGVIVLGVSTAVAEVWFVMLYLGRCHRTSASGICDLCRTCCGACVLYYIFPQEISAGWFW